MAPAQWIVLVLFAALMLVVSMFALSASGHFPKEHRAKKFISWLGAFVLFGSILLSAVCLAAGIFFVQAGVPWYAAVIGGGVSVLAAPLVLQIFSDSFVNGRTSLLVFTALAAGLSAALPIRIERVDLAGFSAIP